MLIFIFKYWRYIAAIAILVTFYGYGEFKYYSGKSIGKTECVLKFKEASEEAEKQSKKGANHVRKREQTLSKKRVIAELNALGILRDDGSE